MALSASSTNDDPHTVSLYTDITGEWLSADIKLPMNWTTTTEDDIVIHQGQLQEPHVFGEISDRAQCKHRPSVASLLLMVEQMARYTMRHLRLDLLSLASGLRADISALSDRRPYLSNWW